MGSKVIGRSPEPAQLSAALQDFERNKKLVYQIKQEIASLKPGQALTYPLDLLCGDMFRIVLALAEKFPLTYRVWKYNGEVFIMREVEP